MYSPSQFKVEDTQAMLDLIAQNPLATVIHTQGTRLVADHIPLMHVTNPQGQACLIGHVARNNPIWQMANDQEVLAVFQGASVYISPNWYATKQAGGKVVPTWNYTVVHASCQLKSIEEPTAVLNIITQLTNQQEAGQQHPWRVEDAPSDFTEKLLDHIVGIELTVKQLDGKWKVSQNQPPQNQSSVQAGLIQAGSEAQVAMAHLVKQHGQ
ncbi:MAG TPA: FMN-binding negative transcriptional regulator [Limnobacter sp.]|nr:FMN-binding negative transcriptional regulator [Limnobacter sp.]